MPARAPDRPGYGTHCRYCTNDDAREFSPDGDPVCAVCAATVRFEEICRGE